MTYAGQSLTVQLVGGPFDGQWRTITFYTGAPSPELVFPVPREDCSDLCFDKLIYRAVGRPELGQKPLRGWAGTYRYSHTKENEKHGKEQEEDSGTQY